MVRPWLNVLHMACNVCGLGMHKYARIAERLSPSGNCCTTNPTSFLLAPTRQAKADVEALCEERCQLAQQQQALKYERRIGELEAAGCGERAG